MAQLQIIPDADDYNIRKIDNEFNLLLMSVLTVNPFYGKSSTDLTIKIRKLRKICLEKIISLENEISKQKPKIRQLNFLISEKPRLISFLDARYEDDNYLLPSNFKTLIDIKKDIEKIFPKSPYTINDIKGQIDLIFKCYKFKEMHGYFLRIKQHNKVTTENVPLNTLGDKSMEKAIKDWAQKNNPSAIDIMTNKGTKEKKSCQQHEDEFKKHIELLKKQNPELSDDEIIELYNQILWGE